jgi:hypothetical protein
MAEPTRGQCPPIATPNQQLSTTVITILPNRDLLIFEDILQVYRWFIKKRSVFTVLLLVWGVFCGLACEFVRKMSKKRRKTKKNEEK